VVHRRCIAIADSVEHREYEAALMSRIIVG